MTDLAEAHLYLRPIAITENPQIHEGAALRLGGSMAWAAMLAFEWTHRGELVGRRVFPVDAWDDEVGRLSDEQAARAETLLANIRRAHGAWTLGGRTLRFDQPLAMGILNCTPDSFSDGGNHGDPEVAIEAGFAMGEAGAALIDVGGESTRPDAPLVWDKDEMARIVPVIERLAKGGLAISVDTRKATVMEAALAAGAQIVNDVSALHFDEDAMALVAKAGVPVILMHAPSDGPDPHPGGRYDDVVFDVFDFLEMRIEACLAAGIAREKIMIDPGIGFGKSLADNLALVNRLAIFHALGQPLLFAASRKRMIGALSNEATVDKRLPGTIALGQAALDRGAHMLRVHDVPETMQAIHVWRGLRDSALTAF